MFGSFIQFEVLLIRLGGFLFFWGCNSHGLSNLPILQFAIFEP